MGDVTRLLAELQEGDGRATDRLVVAVYGELRRLATQKLAHEPAGQTLQPTALVHEAYLRLLGSDTSWQNRAHFFGAAAEAMRRILVERARRRARLKHGGGRARVELKDSARIVEPDPVELLALDEALAKLAREDETKAELVKLRHFAGLTLDQAADVLRISPATADRYWAYARAWLFDEIRKG